MGSADVEETVADAGAQYFTARTEPFRAHVDTWVESGVVAEWRGRIVRIEADGSITPAKASTRYVGVPTMSSLPVRWAEELDVAFGCEVTGLTRDRGVWYLASGSRDLGAYERVILALPPPEAADVARAPQGSRSRSALRSVSRRTVPRSDRRPSTSASTSTSTAPSSAADHSAGSRATAASRVAAIASAGSCTRDRKAPLALPRMRPSTDASSSTPSSHSCPRDAGASRPR